jgi:oligogalacturonide lyase
VRVSHPSDPAASQQSQRSGEPGATVASHTCTGTPKPNLGVTLDPDIHELPARSALYYADPFPIRYNQTAGRAERTLPIMARHFHEWVEPETGRRVVRLSDETGSTSLYFNVNGYTPEGDILVISTLRGLDKVDMDTLESVKLFRTERPFKFLFVGLKYRRAYYQTLDDNTVCYVDIDTGNIREVARVDRGDIQAINCDETLLSGVETDPGSTSEILRLFENRDRATDQFDYRANWPDGTPMSYADAKEVRLNQRLKARIPMKMFVIETESEKRRDVYESTDWLNHLLFSPTDPNLLM